MMIGIVPDYFADLTEVISKKKSKQYTQVYRREMIFRSMD